MIRFLSLYLVLVGCIQPGWTQQSKADEDAFLKFHNDAREDLIKCRVKGQPPPAKMIRMKWDSGLAEKAAQLASKCKLGHDTREERATSKFKSVGQNSAAGQNMKQIFDMWFNEHKKYNFDSGRCSGTCGHYTQVVDVRSTHLGCAQVKCPKSFKYGSSWVCNYGPAGNFRGTKPYDKGTGCGRSLE